MTMNILASLRFLSVDRWLGKIRGSASTGKSKAKHSRKNTKYTSAIIANTLHMARYGKRIVLLYLFLPLSIIFTWLSWMAIIFSGLKTEAGLEIAQIGRHLMRGDGFVTSSIRPLCLSYLPLTHGHPDIITPPFMPALNAALFLLMGPTDRVAALSSGLGWMICALLVYFLSVCVFAKRTTGLIALFFWLVNVAALRLSLTAEPLMWTSAFVTLSFFLLLAIARQAAYIRLGDVFVPVSRWSIIYWLLLALSICTGILALCAPVFYPIVLLPLLFSIQRIPAMAGLSQHGVASSSIRRFSRGGASPQHRRKGLLTVLLVVPGLLLALPWTIRRLYLMQAHGGVNLAAFRTLAYSSEYPGLSVYQMARQTPEPPWYYLITNTGAWLAGSFRAMALLPEIWIQLAGTIPLLLFVLSLPRKPNATVLFLRWRFLAMVALAIPVFSLRSVDASYFAAFVPVLSVFAAGHLQSIMLKTRTKKKNGPVFRLGRSRLLHLTKYFFGMLRHQILYGIVLFFAALPLLGMRLHHTGTKPFLLPTSLEWLVKNSSKDDVILTDIPEAIAWYVDRVAVWLPREYEDFRFLQQQEISVDWILLVNNPRLASQESGAWHQELLQPMEIWHDYENAEPTRFMLTPQVILRKRRTTDQPPDAK